MAAPFVHLMASVALPRIASQKLYLSVEKEAMSIVEAINHWSHFSGKKKFELIAVQRPVAYMFDNYRQSKIKNMNNNKTETKDYGKHIVGNTCFFWEIKQD